MKTEALIKQLQAHPDEEVIALVYYKDTFDPNINDDAVLTKEGWHNVVTVIEDEGGLDNPDNEITALIDDISTEQYVEAV